jgi:hypothetical protein
MKGFKKSFQWGSNIPLKGAGFIADEYTTNTRND